MKWILIMVFVVLSSSCYALSVENMHHTDEAIGVFRIAEPIDGVTTLLIGHNQSYYGIFKITKQLEKLNSTDYNHTYETMLMVKMTNPLSKLEIKNYTHESFGNVLLNITETQILKNNSFMYNEFIESINSSIPIIVGPNEYDDYVMIKTGAGIDGFVKTNLETGAYPFNAVVISTMINFEKIIFVYGNGIEGEIAGLRYVKEHKDDFPYLDSVQFINSLDALAVYDYMHTPENEKWFNTGTSQFYSIVNTSLFGMVDYNIINVTTNDGVSLRVLKINSLNTEKFINFTNNNTLPIVLARGLWSNLYAWQDFGVEMAEDGRRVYLVEITGGPGQDCSDCVNYDFDELVNSYWPALIGTVQTLENGSMVQYVGHSNGARTGIVSLERYNEAGVVDAGAYFNGSDWVTVNMTAHPVDMYIAVGMPGAFDGVNPLGGVLQNKGEEIELKINQNNLTHITLKNLIEFGLTNINSASNSDSDKISVGLWNNYYNWISSENDTQPGASGINLDNFMVIQGTILGSTDLIVNTNDEEALYNNINSSNKYYFTFATHHTGIADNKKPREVMKEMLDTKQINTSYPFNYKNGTNK